MRNKPVRKWLLVSGLVLVLSSPARGASLFDEQDKDADAARKVEVEEDREITAEENRKFVQSNEDYLTSKVKTLEEKIRVMRAQIAALEADIQALRSKAEPLPQDQSQE